MINILEKENIVTSFVKQIAITICIGALYFFMLIHNPGNYLVGLPGIESISNIRWANVLRPLALIFPASVFGISAGAYMFNVYTGKILIGMYPIMPFIILGVAIVMCSLSNIWGRSTSKDLIVLTLWGLIIGVMVSLHITSIAILLTPVTWGKLLSIGVAWKIFTHIAVMWIGYPITRYIEEKIKK
jgi:hypothetical protein